MICNKRFFFIIKEMLLSGYSYFFKTAHYLKNRRFLSLSFSTGCDPYKLDYSIVKNCQNEIIAFSDESNRLEYLGREGLYCVGLERRNLSKGKISCNV